MRKITFCFSIFCAVLTGENILKAQYVGPAPAHVIVVMEENYSYKTIIGNSLAPCLNALAKDTSITANMTLATAIMHPSEPNYLDLFSGTNHGVVTDLSGPAPNAPFNDCNLGSSIIQAGKTFIGYSEDQPSVGWYQGDAGNYYTKHCPWINWIGYGVPAPYDSVPIASDLPMFPLGTYFPDSNHYSNLPTMTWVIPNSVDDMHDGTAPTAIPNGDNWFKKNMMPLVRWVANPANNAVMIVIWDEDDYASGSPSNHIPLFIVGGIVKGGSYGQAVNHYSVLRMMEEMYGLPECGSSATANEVPSAIWKAAVGINSIAGITNKVITWPVPAKDELKMAITSVAEGRATIGLYDITGRMVKQMTTDLKSGDNNVVVNTGDISNGIYFLNIVWEKMNVCQKIIVSK
jgi:hypothetical protein